MINVLHITSPNPYLVAGKIVYDIHFQLGSMKNYNSKILTIGGIGQEKNGIIYLFRNKLESLYFKLKMKLLFIPKNNYDENYYYRGEDLRKTIFSSNYILKRLMGFKPDCIIIYFNQKFLSPRNIYEIYKKTNAKIYYYLMDMSEFTGGCGYSWNCNGYQHQCGLCPAIYSNSNNDITNKIIKNKRKYLSRIDLNILCGSTELMVQAKKSVIFNRSSFYKLLIGIDEIKYNLLNDTKRDYFRKKYSLPENKRIFFVGAIGVDEKRKGFHILKDSILMLLKLNPELLSSSHFIIAGRNAETFLKLFIEFKIGYTFLGQVSHDRLPEIYGISDFYISPSIVDSGPMMVNQSIVSGTPVIAFNIGVAKDLVINEVSGYNIPNIDSFDLYIILKNAIEIPLKELNTLKKSTRNYGLGMSSVSSQINLLDNLISVK